MTTSKLLKSQERRYKKCEKSSDLLIAIIGLRNIISPIFSLYETLSLY